MKFKLFEFLILGLQEDQKTSKVIYAICDGASGAFKDHISYYLKLAVDAGCPLDEGVMDIACQNRTLELVEVLSEMKCPCSKSSLRHASEYDNPEILALLDKNFDCFADEEACISATDCAASRCNLKSLELLLKTAGHPVSFGAVKSAIMRTEPNLFKVLKCIFEHNKYSASEYLHLIEIIEREISLRSEHDEINKTFNECIDLINCMRSE